VGVRGVNESADDLGSDPRELYAATYGRLVGMLTLVAGSRAEAEDVVQEAFARLLPQWPRVCRYDNPEAWVRTVAFRLLWNRVRRARNAVAALRRRGSSEGHVAAPSTETVDVQRALAALSLPQRQVVVLHHLLDLSVYQIAAELGVPIGTVKSRLGRARTILAPLLREDISDHA
jgi:RNA polymerase sigma-70 factor, ECF subfamily